MLVIWKKIKLEPYHTPYIRMNQGYKRQKHKAIQVLEENLDIGKGFLTVTQNPDIIEEIINNIVYISIFKVILQKLP